MAHCRSVHVFYHLWSKPNRKQKCFSWDEKMAPFHKSVHGAPALNRSNGTVQDVIASVTD